MTSLHRDTWLWNAERDHLGRPGEPENTGNIVRGGGTQEEPVD